MSEYLSFGLLVFTTFLTLINPLGIMPVFLTMTANFPEQERKRTARKAYLVAYFTILAFAFSGQLLFSFFRITVESFRVVGGIIFFFIGKDMLNAKVTTLKVSEDQVRAYVGDISVTPLAIPMICGPGSITNAIVLMEDAKDPLMIIIMALAIAVVCFLAFLVLNFSGFFSKLLGETGQKIMLRLMGLIMMVIAVEFFVSGLKPIIRDIWNIA